MKDRKNGNKISKKILLLLLAIALLVVIGLSIFNTLEIYKINTIFAQKAELKQDELDNPIFKIEKILVYSAANVADSSEDSNLSDISISQFTDFAIYIDNTVTIEELTEENTVNSIYIDNIEVSKTALGTQKVYYKDIDDLCVYKKVSENLSEIEFNVLHSNTEKEQNITSNCFYTDCSEPLVITYVNENIVEDEDLSNSNSIISLDGSILDYLEIDLDDLNYTISFTINIENNLGELYKCDYSLDMDLSSDDGGIYTGYIMQIYDTSEQKYKFIKY